MSHFLCLVAGADPEFQLAPFHEFESTGLRDEFVQEHDKTDEYRAEYEKAASSAGVSLVEWITYNYGHEPCTRATIDPEGEHKYGYILLNDDGEMVKAVDITNPNKKWDWWTIGGRYSDRLLLKDGSYTNSAPKGSIDWSAMEHNAGSNASRRYLDARVVLDQHPAWEPWGVIRERHKDDMDTVRRVYNEQPAVAAWEDKWSGPDEFLVSHEEYVQAAVDGAYPGFAFVKDRQWFEKGEMGWFGITTNETSAREWNKAKREFIQSLPDDMLITVVDCHI